MAEFLSFLFKKKTQEDTFRWSSDDEEEASSSAPSRLEMAGSSVKEDLTLEIMEPSIRMEHQMKLGLATIFSYEELKEATRSFDSSQVIGEGGFGRVYLGKYHGRMVAVKFHYEKFRDEVFDEVKFISQFRHDNIATVYGSTDTCRKKILVVHEYVAKGNLGYHLHGLRPCEHWPGQELERIALSWAVRIRIAVETAEALLYLHSLKPPFVHKNLTTSNILLDAHCHVKLTGFSLSVKFTLDNLQHLKFSPGDPIHTTYDVYSFGLILLQLISGKSTWDISLPEYRRKMSKWVLNLIQKNELDQLVDTKLNYHSNLDTQRMVQSVAELAYKCLLPEGDERPTMMEVLSALKVINMTVN